MDFYYHLPEAGNETGTRRLKLRIEPGQDQLIYYYDRQEQGARTSNFQLWDVVASSPIREVLDAALGVKTVVRKQRELWRRENVVFHLDTVEGVGPVFEVEAKAVGGYDVDEQIVRYRRSLAPIWAPTSSVPTRTWFADSPFLRRQESRPPVAQVPTFMGTKNWAGQIIFANLSYYLYPLNFRSSPSFTPGHSSSMMP